MLFIGYYCMNSSSRNDLAYKVIDFELKQNQKKNFDTLTMGNS